MTLTLPQRKALHRKWLQNGQGMTLSSIPTHRTPHYSDTTTGVSWSNGAECFSELKLMDTLTARRKT